MTAFGLTAQPTSNGGLYRLRTAETEIDLIHVPWMKWVLLMFIVCFIFD
jgi:hypothetical protein